MSDGNAYEAKQPKRTLLRLHVSTFAFITLVAGLLFMANVPGQLVTEVMGLDSTSGDCLSTELLFEHGWPLTYLNRSAELYDPPQPPPSPPSPWRWSEGSPEFMLRGLLADLATAVGALLAAGALFEIWRRRRRRLLQLHFIELFALVGLVACVCGWFVWQRAQYQQESRIVERMEQAGQLHPTVLEDVVRHQGGPTWLRRIVGEESFQFFDRVVAIQIIGTDEAMKNVLELRHAKVVRVIDPNGMEFDRFAQLPQLEELHICGESKRPDLRTAELPYLPRLKRLVIEGVPRLPCLDANKLPAIESLGVLVDEVTEADLRRLGALTTLKRLSVNGKSTIGESLAHLSALNLDELQLGDDSATDEALRHLALTPRVTELWLDYSSATNAGLVHLARLPRLKSLWTHNTPITDEAIGALRWSSPNCAFYTSGFFARLPSPSTVIPRGLVQ